jgi:hypothetical protein
MWAIFLEAGVALLLLPILWRVWPRQGRGPGDG